MSLDVYLTVTAKVEKKESSGPKIFIRKDGRTQEITRAKWDELNPGKEPVTWSGEKDSSEVFHYNITHNLNTMAEEAGLYQYLWRPDEIDIEKAHQLSDHLHQGLDKLLDDPAKFKKFNPENGWGSYEDLVGFVTNYLIACREYPDADVKVSR